MKTFTLFWLDGKADVVTGNDIGDAITRAGWGGGAIRALDFWHREDARADFDWSDERRRWVRKAGAK